MADEWKKLLDDAGLSPEERATAEAAFAIPGLQRAANTGVIHQAEYSRKMDELAKETKRLTDNWNKANDEYVAAMSERDTTIAERDEATRKLAEAERKLAEATAQPVVPAVDTSKFVSADAFDERLKQFAAGQTAYFGDTLEAVDEIAALTGTRVPAKKLLQDAMTAGKTPLAYAEETYQLSAKRTEQAAAARQKEIDEAVERGYQKRVGEEANPATRTVGSSKDPFYVPQPSGEAKNPWDETEVPQAEQTLLSELMQVGRS